jgi:hypothetical protein
MIPGVFTPVLAKDSNRTGCHWSYLSANRNSVPSGGVPFTARRAASSCQEANSVFEKVLNCPQKMCYAASIASNNARDRMFIDSSEV